MLPLRSIEHLKISENFTEKSSRLPVQGCLGGRVIFESYCHCQRNRYPRLPWYIRISPKWRLSDQQRRAIGFLNSSFAENSEDVRVHRYFMPITAILHHPVRPHASFSKMLVPITMMLARWGLVRVSYILLL